MFNQYDQRFLKEYEALKKIGYWLVNFKSEILCLSDKTQISKRYI